MIINHNMSAMYANRSLGVTASELNKNMEKLASGQRINRAGDDASGLAVSEKLRGQIRGLNQAQRNIENGVSFIQTTEGYLQETQDILHRVRELAVQSSNGIYTAEDRMQIQVEVSQLVDEINRIASHAQFNGMNILTGRFAKEGEQVMQLQVGANMDQNERVFIGTMTATALGLQGAQGATGVRFQSRILRRPMPPSATSMPRSRWCQSSVPTSVPIRTASRWPLRASLSRLRTYRQRRAASGTLTWPARW
ncbi:hypothetical protein MASR2M48_06280 [Spirochaetota bacterium]